jgi:uncharacterized protein (DUF2249 family)
MVSNQPVKLDVRDDLRQGREPFSRIMEAVAELEWDQDLIVVAPFEPAPLLGLMARRGFGHESHQTKEGDFEVRFSRALPVASSTKPTQAAAASTPQSVDLDTRGLEPPMPMVKILEALPSLFPRSVLRARTDRRPMHLFPQLEARGFTGECVEQTDGSFITHIHRH